MNERDQAFESLQNEVSALFRHVRTFVAAHASTVHPDLLPTGYYLLSWLNGHGPVRAAVLVDTFQTDKGAVSRQIHHLDDLGLIERKPDPTDGRATLLVVTAEGKERLATADSERRTWMEDRLADWHTDDLAAFAAAFARYNEAISEFPNPRIAP